VLAPFTLGLDLKYYWDLTGGSKQRICNDAALSNPDIVKQLQSIAEHYVKQIHTELAVLVRNNPVLLGVGRAPIEVRGANKPEHVMCGFEFMRNTHMVQTASGGHLEPDKDGCVLRVWASNIIAYTPWDKRGRDSACFLVHEIEMRASYRLWLSEENNDLDKTVRALIDQRFKEMCDEMKKLQTAEDKAADTEQ